MPESTEERSLNTDGGSRAMRPSETTSRKQPPPDSPHSIRIRGFVISSFWAIVILLGLPTWSWTTSIHRARLPLEEMLEWADGKVCDPEASTFLVPTKSDTFPRLADHPFPCKSQLKHHH